MGFQYRTLTTVQTVGVY